MKKIFLTVLILLLFPLAALATEDITVSQLLAQSEVNELEEIEQQRQKDFETQLGFSLPEYTDNPSYVITFTDPSPNGNGVQIEIDGKEFVGITSPYTFPALSIGQHTVKFRFNDKDGNTQTLEYNFIVIPRTPIINPPTIEDSSIVIMGTGLSNSDVFLFLTSNTFNHKELVRTNSNGEWSTTVIPQEGLVKGIYTVTGYTRKYGYASELSDPTVFEVGNNGNNLIADKSNTVAFSFKNINTSNVVDILSRNPDLIILIAVPLVLGILLTALLRKLNGRSKEEKIYKNVEKSIQGEKNGEEKTLRELFESNGKEKKKEDRELKINTDVSKKINKERKEERVISKEDFLKEYKSADPDDISGKEKPAEKVKKEIKVSLTSREE